MLVEPPRIIQVQSMTLTSDVSTTSGSFVDLPGMSITMVTDNNPVWCWFTASGQTQFGSVTFFFQLVIDGSGVAGGILRSDGTGNTQNSTIISFETAPLSRGSHTFKIQWKSDGAAQAQILPVTNPNFNHAAMILREIRAMG